ncbi:MAG: Rpn family recombination-promoting nuclease/putative transposase [Lachnospiraceae bacterium]|nr:Rpn family recombination-promoting nuclease/putative transposase [Lachnospiraceae bacterium]
MGKVENAFIPFLEQPEEFADLFNGFVFDGKQVILPENLSPLSESMRTIIRSKDDSFETVKRFRDIGRLAKIGTTQALLVCAVEHQDYLDYTMPQRVMLYEALEYQGQIMTIKNLNRKKGVPSEYFISKVTLEDKLIPVITIVVYSGTADWEGACCLHDMLDLDGIPDSAIPYINNWSLNLINLNEPTDASKYQSDLRLLFELAKLKKDEDEDAMNDYIRSQEKFKNLSEYTCYMLSQFLNIKIEFNDYKDEAKGGINMCKAIEKMMETARKKGVEQGLEQGIEQGLEQGIEQGRVLGEHRYLMRLVQSKYNKGKNLSQIADECETTEENILSVMEELHLAF